MPLSALTGTRLRERRLAAGLRQADVAGAAGISASYLNLIEHNRRKVTPQVLDRLAGALGLDRAALEGGQNPALLEDLRAAAARGGLTPAELERLEEFADRFPGWAALLVRLGSQAQTLERAVEALNDRMTHDPHLSQALHELLSSLTSVRATAAILADTVDLEPDWAARFHRNLRHDSERLAAGAEALVAYLNSGGEQAGQGIASPQEEVEDWLSARRWRLEDAELAEGLEGEIAELQGPAARALARGHVARAAADAQALPEPALREALVALGPDPLAIAERFQVAPLVAMRRIASLPDLGAGLVVCDASGTLTFRKPAAGFPLPRFGAACPLWPLYAALARQQLPIETAVEIAGQSGRRHRVVAVSALRHPLGLRGPELREAGMLILPDSGGTGPVLPIGSSCRVCPRPGCVARREPSILTAEAEASRF
ncbi:helix-turn-helix domain-containing protein [Tabrizicola aquatica]|uniref:helix-turn-helix domain-containing protein n=1 Tax=Tabrizicola aquatica TaxID=909926 RepID=UPI000CD25284|nr:helix-turn-helix domain-containing protein [Tabrizicola aquatica]